MRSDGGATLERYQAAVFKALGHPARWRMVMVLAEGERCVCDLVESTGLGWSTVSRHLAVLKSVGLVLDDKRGMQVFYRLGLPCVVRFAACLEQAPGGRDVAFPVCGCEEGKDRVEAGGGARPAWVRR